MLEPSEHLPGNPEDRERIGLCATCIYARVIAHPRGGLPYYRCALFEIDPRFPRFPALPVRECSGYKVEDHEVRPDNGIH